MRKVLFPVVLAFLLGGTTFSLIRSVLGQGPSPERTILRDVQDNNVREITSVDLVDGPQQPNIGFIDSPSSTCYQPDPNRDVCYLTWYYLSVSAAPSYMLTMTLSLNDRGPVSHTQGFFQTSMYVPYNMLGDGIKVACGAPGAAGKPTLGNAYGYTIRARDSAGLSSANFGTVHCPAYRP